MLILDFMILVILIIITLMYLNKASENIENNKPHKNNTIQRKETEPFVSFDYSNDKIIAIENNILIKPSELGFPYKNRLIQNPNSNEERSELELNLNNLYNSSTEANIDEIYDYLTSI
jgi:hypothetical protein